MLHHVRPTHLSQLLEDISVLQEHKIHSMPEGKNVLLLIHCKLKVPTKIVIKKRKKGIYNNLSRLSRLNLNI